MLLHYCIITAQAIIVLLLMPKYFVQVLTDRENYFVKNSDHKILVQQNNIFKKKVIFINQIHLSNYLIAINQF